MYKYYAQRRAALARWMLDDTYPFQENSGSLAAGTKKTGTSDPTFSTALVCGAEFSTVFKSTSIGQFACNVFKQGLEQRPFVLEAWVLPIPKTTTGNQAILSHDGIFDGLSINGKVIRFSTDYATYGSAACTFDLIEYQLAHIVGLHTADKNELYVNGVKVSEVTITDDQKKDTYVTTDNFLYSGYTTSTQEIAVNGVAIYASLSGEQIAQNYAAGTQFVGQANVAPQLDGDIFNLDSAKGSVFTTRVWDSAEEFNRGRKTNVSISPTTVVPSYESGLSVAGSWIAGMPLDEAGDTSIYGVALSWSGEYITVDVSLDGTTWSAATNGSLVPNISNGYNPTNKDLWIRVNFAGGLAVDPAYLESMTAVGIRNNVIANSLGRSVTVSHPAVPRGDFETNLYRDDNGISLKGGALTIGPDLNTNPNISRTLELWIKPISGTTTISVGGTKYRNGALDSTLPIGEWSLIHYVAAADITTDITVTGDCIVGQAATYQTALTATQVTFIADSYCGRNALRWSDPIDIGLSDAATPVNIYAHDWAIDSAG